MITIRRFLTVFLTLVLSVTLISAFGCSKTSADVIRETVSQEFDAYKNLEDSALEKIAKTAEDKGLADLGISGVDFASEVLDGFDYHIDDVKVNSDHATVAVTIVSKSASDFETKLSRRVQEFVDSDRSQTMTTEEKNQEVGNITMQAFKDTEIIEEQVKLDFELQDKTWVSTNVSETLSQLDSLVFAS